MLTLSQTAQFGPETNGAIRATATLAFLFSAQEEQLKSDESLPP
jgi:hypothetical protein